MRILILLSCCFIFNINAAVWETKHQWNEEFEKKYQESLSSIKKNIFIDKDSDYYGLSADCADLVYIIRAKFAYENNLPFKVFLDKQYVSNNNKRFDSISDSLERFKTFIKYISRTRGTDSLRDKDTYAVAIKDIKPGDIYHYEILKKGKRVRHVLVVKKIHSDGRFSFLSSTQAIARNNKSLFNGDSKWARELIEKKHQTIYHLPNENSGGFRRYKTISTKEDNQEQFNLAKQGIKEFRSKLHKSLATKKANSLSFEETPSSICKEMKQRLKIVKEARNFLKEKKECLNYREYDAYSTPIKDQEILMKLSNFNHSINDSFCELKISNNTVYLRDVIKNFKEAKISSDPHQTIKARWGLEEEKQHNCKIYY